MKPSHVLFLLLGGAALAQDHAGWVVIPANEYAVLRSRAYPTALAPPTPPADATLTRVDYDLKLDGAIAAGCAALTIDVLKDGWVRVPIPPGLLVREARLGGSLVPLVPANATDPQLTAVLSHKGRAVLDLDVVFPVTGNRGEERLSLPAAASGVTRASLTRAAQDAELRISGGLVTEKSPTHWLAYARANEPLVFTWSRKVEQPKPIELPLRMRGTLTQLFVAGEDSTSVNADIEIEVQQGAARQVSIAVPESVTINQVPGATVADWDVAGGQLKVNFLEPVEHTAKFTIAGETRLPRDGAIAVPLLRLLDVERESGGAAVEIQGAGEIDSSQPQGLDRVEAADLGTLVAARQSPSVMAFRLRTGASSRSLQVHVARYAQQAVLTANVEDARYRVLMSADGKVLIQARYAVRNNQRTFIRITLPVGATLWIASLAGRPVRPGSNAASLLFPLAKARAGEEAPVFPIEVLYLARTAAWNQKGRAALPLPTLDLPISRTGVNVYYPAQFRVSAEAGAFRPQPYERPATDIWNAPVEPTTVVLKPSAAQALVDNYRNRDARKSAADVPARFEFPSVGRSLFLVSELTGESKSEAIQLDYQKEKRGIAQ
jgi:hypothetical protein